MEDWPKIFPNRRQKFHKYFQIYDRYTTKENYYQKYFKIQADWKLGNWAIGQIYYKTKMDDRTKIEVVQISSLAGVTRYKL